MIEVIVTQNSTLNQDALHQFIILTATEILAVIAFQAAVAIYYARLVEALQDAYYNDLRVADQLKTNSWPWQFA